jgi:hypothetical protein
MPRAASTESLLAGSRSGSDRRMLASPDSQHSAPVRREEARSTQVPALCSHQRSLILAWSSADHNINLTRLR